MIALDTSAIVAIALEEQEEDAFAWLIAANHGLVGAPVLLEARLVLTSKMVNVDSFLDKFIDRPSIHPVAFSLAMYRHAVEAFDRFGKGRGHPAKLNICDCMAYAVAKAHDVPLLYKGTDFARTDIRSAIQ